MVKEDKSAKLFLETQRFLLQLFEKVGGIIVWLVIFSFDFLTSLF